ncbi:ATP-binding protein [Rhizobium sp. RU20A]|uniref:ATP-binding protein n=1 Tax=Rhizobium sp. RU20A TaxID=1907412 RepID=UPI00122C4E96|nr:ATP-binding protein [Rhizobium sp. RU20A]
MAAKQYPFIDIAVHPAVRAHFASGAAAALMSTDLLRVLWANGAAAALFSTGNIYDFIDSGLPANDVMTRQLQAAARQLSALGETRSVSLRIASGFRSTVVVATLSLIEIHAGEPAVLFAAPVSASRPGTRDCAARMISGFDDPDTHMAVLGTEGEVIAASAGFDALGLRPDTAQALISAVARHPDRLVKRPITTGRGTLPAAIGRVSDEMHLLFAVETILGRLDPMEDEDFPAAAAAPAAAQPLAVEDAAVQTDAASGSAEPRPVDIDEVPGSDEDPALPAAPPKGDEETFGAPEPVETDEAEDHPPMDDAAFAEASTVASAGDVLAAAGDQAAVAFTPADHMAVDIDELPGSDEDPALLTCPPENGEEPVATPAATGEAHDPSTIVHSEEGALPADDVATDEAPQKPTDDETPEVSRPEVARDDAAQDGVSAAPGTTEPATKTNVSTGVAATREKAAEPAEPVFTFQPGGRAVRFVWKIDADGHFSEVSDEFAATVGPHAGDVVGKSFAALAERFHIDPDGVITGLLQRRDTWSGKTVLWPVEGTRLKVPVDLAALPTYSRARSFDGFRGFGIVRVSDAAEDADGIGLTLVSGADVLGAAVADAPETEDDLPEALGELTTGDTAEGVPTDDPFAGETPALQYAAAPVIGENVIPLSSIRQPVREPLSRGEQAAFREIARRLGETIDSAPASAPAETDRATEDKADALEAAGSPAVAPTVEAAPAPPADTDNGTTGAAESTDTHDDPVDAERLSQSSDEAADAPTVSRNDHAEDTDGLAEPVTDAAYAEDNTNEAALAPEPAAPVETMAVSPDIDDGEEASEDALDPDSARRGTGLDESLIDALPVALLVHNGDNLFHANPEFLNLTGYASLADLDAEGGLDALFAAPEDDEEELLDGTMQLIRPEGRLLAVTARLRSIRWHDGHALLLALAPAVDLDGSDSDSDEPIDTPTETASAFAPAAADSEQMAALRTEVDELRSILETATDGVVVLGPEGEIRSLNRSASALFNYDESETRGKPFAMLFAHESQRAVMDYIAGLSGHGVASVLNDGREVIGREASGGFLPLFMTMGRLSASNGFCAVIRDITQWKRTEDELRSAKRAAETANAHKTEFLARVSHEIRTPLNAIIGFSDMMASEHFGAIGNPRYVEYASDIGRSGRHVLDIVNDLLDISKIEAGEMELEFSAVELNEAIAEAVSLVQPQANAQRVIIRTSLSGAVPRVVADQRSVKQIALNILSNAIRFTPSGGQIVVSCGYEPNGNVILRIRDTGVGMTRGELEQAMKPFRQVTTGARKRGDGTGLGLPLTKAMVEANRAQFAITSAPNEGTLVEITFPSQRVLAD